MEVMQLILVVFNGLLTIVLVLSGFIIKGILRRIEVLESEVKGMKDNYLDRFKEVLQNQSDVKIELLKEQYKVKEELVKHYTDTKDEIFVKLNSISAAVDKQATVCQMIQNQKNNH